MLKNLFIITVLITSLAACKSKSAFKYSEDIVAKERSLTSEIQSTETKVGNYITANHYDSVAVAGERMEKLVQQKIDEIDAMPVPKAEEADNFKAATLRYFKYIKSLYTSYKDLGNAQTDEGRQDVISVLKKLVADKSTVLKEMQGAQARYAKANGFKVQ
jgi:hypothetical protein